MAAIGDSGFDARRFRREVNQWDNRMRKAQRALVLY
jgi:hypothetical protein